MKADGRIGSVPHSSIKFTWDIKWGHLLHMALPTVKVIKKLRKKLIR